MSRPLARAVLERAETPPRIVRLARRDAGTLGYWAPGSPRRSSMSRPDLVNIRAAISTRQPEWDLVRVHREFHVKHDPSRPRPFGRYYVDRAVHCGGGGLCSPLHRETRPGSSGSDSHDLTPTLPNDNTPGRAPGSDPEVVSGPPGEGICRRKTQTEPGSADRLPGSVDGAHYWATVGAVNMFHVKRLLDTGMRTVTS